jgi:hypothetical protein
VTQALRIGMLNDQNVVYVAHVSKKRGKLPDGRFGLIEVFNVSAPIYCEKFAKVSLDDGLAIVDVPALADAIQAATGTPELIARLSADKDMTKRTLKLFGT